MSNEALAEALIPLAAELVGTVRDYGPDAVAAVLARVPEGRHDALAVVLAAMVNPDARPRQLLAWTELGPVPSRDEFVPTHLQMKEVAREQMGRLPDRRAAVQRLTAAGLTAEQIAIRLGITKRSVVRHRSELRRALEAVA